jgi:hypothetical protein
VPLHTPEYEVPGTDRGQSIEGGLPLGWMRTRARHHRCPGLRIFVTRALFCFCSVLHTFEKAVLHTSELCKREPDMPVRPFDGRTIIRRSDLAPHRCTRVCRFDLDESPQSIAFAPVNVGTNWKAQAWLILVNLSSSFIGSPMRLATGPPLYDGVPRSSLLCSRPGSVF